ncbi:MAG: glycosyltransferase family 4 protein [Burkholderiaceae bacterium]|nr:glycosyltransferase family 4 protein [Burkholderiaceae bacterium]
MTSWWLIPLVAAVSAALTGAMRRHAVRLRLIDLPNLRSSHSVPTPRGGGVAIVLSFLASLAVLGVLGAVPPSLVGALLGAGALVAAVGFFDDLGHVRPRWRLLAHFAGAVWVLVWFDGAPPIVLFGEVVDPGWIGAIVAAVYLAWMLNLYNFMDGIDGIAGVESVCVCLGAALLHMACGQPVIAVVSLSLAAAVLGFLWWNFPPAAIFMGDAGSGFLGIVLGALSLYAGAFAPALYWSWLILLGVFVTDATVTLLRRLLRGERVYEAHRSHAYQHAARRFGSHLPVTLAVGAINVCWLLPIAAWVGLGGLNGLAGMAIAYAPLVALALGFRAGVSETTHAQP